MKRGGNNGFTIVELLIVIVVIAILASISMTTFAGMQTRALNTARASDAKKMKSLIDQYIAINGSQALRSTITSTITCLGQGFEDLNPGANESCVRWYDAESGEYGNYNTSLYAKSLTLDTALSTVGNYSVSGLKPTQYTDEWSSEWYSAPVLIVGENYVYRVDGQIPFLTLNYYLDGDNVDCQMSGVLAASPYANGVINLSTNNTGKNSGSWGGMTYCTLNISRG